MDNTTKQATLIMTVEKSAEPIPAGTYTGQIVGLSVRPSEITDQETGQTEVVNYLDIDVSVDGHELVLNYGVPARVTPKTDLGALLGIFGHPAIPDKKIDVNAALMGRKVRFSTTMKTGRKGGSFSTIVKGSLAPVA